VTISIDIGRTGRGDPATLDLEELLATRLLVQGNSGSGKSHLLRRLLEQSAPWVQQVVIDPEGDFVTLADAHSHLVIDAAAHPEAAMPLAAEQVRAHRISVVLNLEGLDVNGQLRHAAAFLSGLFDCPREQWSPALVVVDEAQLFAPATGGEAQEEARRLSLAAMTNLMCRGRKRGLAGVVATQRLAKLAKNVAAEASNFLMGRTFLDIDMARAADLLGMDRRGAETFRDLQRGHFIALGPALSNRPLPIRIGPASTLSRGAGPGLTPLPETPPEAVRALVFTAMAAPPPVARRQPPTPAPDLLAQLAAARPAALHLGEPVTPDLAAMAEHDRVLDEIMAAMTAEPGAAFRPIAVLYQDFLVRCRIRALPGAPPDLPNFIRRLGSARAGLEHAVTTAPGWDEVAAIARTLPDDAQGLYLLLARTALIAAPCPPDAVLARVYGTHSPARARRVLSFLEQQGVVVVCPEAHDWRAVALPRLGWRTAPGNPAAPDADAA
jgi:hypothetical protein